MLIAASYMTCRGRRMIQSSSPPRRTIRWAIAWRSVSLPAQLTRAGQVRVWDAVSWKNSTLTEFVHPCVVYAAKYQPEGTEPRIVATGGLDGLLRLWNRDDGVMLNAIPQHNRSDHH